METGKPKSEKKSINFHPKAKNALECSIEATGQTANSIVNQAVVLFEDIRRGTEKKGSRLLLETPGAEGEKPTITQIIIL